MAVEAPQPAAVSNLLHSLFRILHTSCIGVWGPKGEAVRQSLDSGSPARRRRTGLLGPLPPDGGRGPVMRLCPRKCEVFPFPRVSPGPVAVAPTLVRAREQGPRRTLGACSLLEAPAMRGCGCRGTRATLTGCVVATEGCLRAAAADRGAGWNQEVAGRRRGPAGPRDVRERAPGFVWPWEVRGTVEAWGHAGDAVAGERTPVLQARLLRRRKFPADAGQGSGTRGAKSEPGLHHSGDLGATLAKSLPLLWAQRLQIPPALKFQGLSSSRGGHSSLARLLGASGLPHGLLPANRLHPPGLQDVVCETQRDHSLRALPGRPFFQSPFEECFAPEN